MKVKKLKDPDKKIYSRVFIEKSNGEKETFGVTSEREELTLEEVSRIISVSEKQIYKNFNKYKSKLEEYNLVAEGKGKKRKFFKNLKYETKEKIAYKLLVDFLKNECGFDLRTNFNKLIHYIYLVFLNSIDSNFKYKNNDFEKIIGLSEKQLIKYRNKLTEVNIMKLKKFSKGIYMYLDESNEFKECNSELYDSFNMCILNECKNLFKSKYTVDLTNSKDYKKAKDIITDDFDFSSIELFFDIKLQKDKKVVKELLTKNNLFYSKEYENFYKIAFFEVSKAWEKEFGIKHVKFFPNHVLQEYILKDKEIIEIIVNAYSYIKSTIE